jgi:SAM-dependent methyltransferase
MSSDPRRLVADGYDRIAERYLAWTAGGRNTERAEYTALLLDRVPAGSRLLELGCGAGVPVTAALAERFRVVGVDISARQLALARANAPGVALLLADMSALAFRPESFAAVCAFYTITHVPRAAHTALLKSIASWLQPGGLFVAALGSREGEGVEDDWLGAPMFFSHFDAETNRRLVQAAGLRLIDARERTEDEDGQPATFLWVVAEKPR